MVSIQRNYKEAAKSLDQLQLEGQGTKIDSVYYYLPSDESLTSLQDTLKTHLQVNK